MTERKTPPADGELKLTEAIRSDLGKGAERPVVAGPGRSKPVGKPGAKAEAPQPGGPAGSPPAPAKGKAPKPPAPAAGNDGWNAGGFIRSGLLILLLLVGGLGSWSVIASLSGAVIAAGELRVETRRQVVQHIDGGTIGEIRVRDGDRVQEGDILIVLDGTQLRADRSILQGQLNELMARKARLQAEEAGSDTVVFDDDLLDAAETDPTVRRIIEGQMSQFRINSETLQKEKSILAERQKQIEEQITGAEAQLAAVRRQVEIIEKDLEAKRTLAAQGRIQLPLIYELERQAAGLQGEIGRITAQMAELRSRIGEIELDLLRMDSTMRRDATTQLRDIEVRVLELLERRTALDDQLNRLDIRAPRTGVVEEMAVTTIGGVVRPAEPIMYVVPTEVRMVVEARFEPQYRDNVVKGQETALVFAAFSRRTTPELTGSVVRVSTDTVTDEQTGMQFYIAEIDVSDEELAKLEGLELVAGMPVEVYMKTSDRSPINYLLKPFLDYLRPAATEPD